MIKEVIIINREYFKLFEQVEKLIHTYNQVEKKRQYFGQNCVLNCSEIHLIDSIGRNPGIGTKGLAKVKGITEGAISQQIKKLIEKKLVLKQVSPESDAKINLYLTEQGSFCYKEHIKYHKQANMKWISLLDELNDTEYGKLNHILHEINKLAEEASL